QYRLPVARPAGEAIGRLLVWVIVVSVHEALADRGVHANRLSGLEVVRHDVLVPEIQEPLAVGRRAHGAAQFLGDERLLARLEVDAIVVAAARSPLDLATI